MPTSAGPNRNAALTVKLLETFTLVAKATGGNASSTICGKSRSFIALVVSPLRRLMASSSYASRRPTHKGYRYIIRWQEPRRLSRDGAVRRSEGDRHWRTIVNARRFFRVPKKAPPKRGEVAPITCERSEQRVSSTIG